MRGFALNCTRGSQAMPRRVEGAKIALLDFNLQKHPRARIQVGGETFEVSAETLHGSERERVWASVLEQGPGYAKRTAREIPLVRLTRG